MKFLKNSILILKIIFLFLLNVCIHFETALSTCYRLILKLEEQRCFPLGKGHLILFKAKHMLKIVKTTSLFPI